MHPCATHLWQNVTSETLKSQSWVRRMLTVWWMHFTYIYDSWGIMTLCDVYIHLNVLTFIFILVWLNVNEKWMAYNWKIVCFFLHTRKLLMIRMLKTIAEKRSPVETVKANQAVSRKKKAWVLKMLDFCIFINHKKNFIALYLSASQLLKTRKYYRRC